MNKLLSTVLAASAVVLLGGCANLVLRTPITSEPVTKVYWPTREQAEFTAMCACPQSFFSPTGDFDFCVENVFTLPLAVVPAADLVVEAALDTVFLPVDACLAGSRKNKQDKE